MVFINGLQFFIKVVISTFLISGISNAYAKKQSVMEADVVVIEDIGSACTQKNPCAVAENCDEEITCSSALSAEEIEAQSEVIVNEEIAALPGAVDIIDFDKKNPCEGYKTSCRLIVCAETLSANECKTFKPSERLNTRIVVYEVDKTSHCIAFFNDKNQTTENECKFTLPDR